MDAAVKCFASKGYRATSIQEIASAIDMAKGSLYFYFASKEDMLISIIREHFDWYEQRINAILEDRSLSARDRLLRQVEFRFASVKENDAFIAMILHDRFEVNQEIRQLFRQFHARMLKADQQSIMELYGEQILPFSYDLATMLGSIINGLLDFKFDKGTPLESGQIATYIMARLDDLVNAMSKQDIKPIFRPEDMKIWIEMQVAGPACEETNGTAEIEAIRSALASLELDEASRKEAEAAASLLEEQFAGGKPNLLLVKGMLALLKELRAASLRKPLAKLEALLEGGN